MIKFGKTLLAFVMFFVTYQIFILVAFPIIINVRADPGWLIYLGSIIVAIGTSSAGVGVGCLMLGKLFEGISTRTIAALFIATQVLFILFGAAIYGWSFHKGIPIDGVFFDGIVPSIHSLAAILATVHLLWDRRNQT